MKTVNQNVSKSIKIKGFRRKPVQNRKRFSVRKGSLRINLKQPTERDTELHADSTDVTDVHPVHLSNNNLDAVVKVSSNIENPSGNSEEVVPNIDYNPQDDANSSEEVAWKNEMAKDIEGLANKYNDISKEVKEVKRLLKRLVESNVTSGEHQRTSDDEYEDLPLVPRLPLKKKKQVQKMEKNILTNVEYKRQIVSLMVTRTMVNFKTYFTD